jgi:uncharacterized membrane-anchored protein
VLVEGTATSLVVAPRCESEIPSGIDQDRLFSSKSTVIEGTSLSLAAKTGVGRKDLTSYDQTTLVFDESKFKKGHVLVACDRDKGKGGFGQTDSSWKGLWRVKGTLDGACTQDRAWRGRSSRGVRRLVVR